MDVVIHTTGSLAAELNYAKIYSPDRGDSLTNYAGQRGHKARLYDYFESAA